MRWKRLEVRVVPLHFETRNGYFKIYGSYSPKVVSMLAPNPNPIMAVEFHPKCEHTRLRKRGFVDRALFRAS